MKSRFRIGLYMPLLLASAGAWAAAAPDPAAGLGRLFTTPDKRALLDAMRARNLPAGGVAEGSQVRLDGIVLRSDGKKTVWLNGAPMHDRMPVEQVGVNSARVVTSPGHSVEVPVGGSVQFASDQGQ
jgi:hypothetical protein